MNFQNQSVAQEGSVQAVNNMGHPSVENFSVTTLEIGGLGAALKALRLPFGKDVRSKLGGNIGKVEDITLRSDEVDYPTYFSSVNIFVHPKDLSLLSTLVKRGDEHAKVLRGVCVWCEINAPRYWHVELDTYRVGAERLSSNSTMHQQGQGLGEDALVTMKEHLEEGTMQKRVWMFSYQTLRRIYIQRHNHRLPQWRIFCDWIKKLPFAEDLILVGLGEQQ